MVLVDSTITLQVISILNLAWAVTTSTTATATTTNSFADFAVPESKRLIIPHLHSVPIDNLDYHMMHRHMVWLKIRKTK